MRSASVQYRYLSPFPTFQVDNKGAGLTKEQEARLKTVIESQIMPGQQEACEQFRSDIMMKVFKGAGCAENKRSEWPEKIQRLWNLYHQGAVGDKDLANEFAEVDLAILKEAIIKIFHQLLGPKWYFKDEASSDNVYYAMGYTFKCFGDVTIPQSTQFEETDGFVTTDGKVKIFKSSYAAFRCSFSYRAPAVPQNTLESFLASGFTQPSVVKVLFQGTENESAWMDVDPSKIMAIGFSYNALEESSFQYNGSNGSFATPLDLDKGPELYSSLYAKQDMRQDEISHSNVVVSIYTLMFLLVATGIGSTGLLTLLLIPGCFLLKNMREARKEENTCFEEFTMSNEEYENATQAEKTLTQQLESVLEENNNTALPLPKEHRGETQICCDKYRRERLLFFKKCHDQGVTVLDPKHQAWLEKNKKSSEDTVMKAITRDKAWQAREVFHEKYNSNNSTRATDKSKVPTTASREQYQQYWKR